MQWIGVKIVQLFTEHVSFW